MPPLSFSPDPQPLPLTHPGGSQLPAGWWQRDELSPLSPGAVPPPRQSQRCSKLPASPTGQDPALWGAPGPHFSPQYQFPAVRGVAERDKDPGVSLESPASPQLLLSLWLSPSALRWRPAQPEVTKLFPFLSSKLLWVSLHTVPSLPQKLWRCQQCQPSPMNMVLLPSSDSTASYQQDDFSSLEPLETESLG